MCFLTIPAFGGFPRCDLHVLCNITNFHSSLKIKHSIISTNDALTTPKFICENGFLILDWKPNIKLFEWREVTILEQKFARNRLSQVRQVFLRDYVRLFNVLSAFFSLKHVALNRWWAYNNRGIRLLPSPSTIKNLQARTLGLILVLWVDKITQMMISYCSYTLHLQNVLMFC